MYATSASLLASAGFVHTGIEVSLHLSANLVYVFPQMPLVEAKHRFLVKGRHVSHKLNGPSVTDKNVEDMLNLRCLRISEKLPRALISCTHSMRSRRRQRTTGQIWCD
jgi:hypothetical protein